MEKDKSLQASNEGLNYVDTRGSSSRAVWRQKYNLGFPPVMNIACKPVIGLIPHDLKATPPPDVTVTEHNRLPAAKDDTCYAKTSLI